MANEIPRSLRSLGMTAMGQGKRDKKGGEALPHHLFYLPLSRAYCHPERSEGSLSY